MAKIVMNALRPEEGEGQPVVHTGVALVGMGGDDCLCGHCGRVILQNFNLGSMRPDMLYICGVCEGVNAAPTRQ